MKRNIDGDATVISSRNFQESNNEGIPRRAAAAAGINRLSSSTFYGKNYEYFKVTLFDADDEKYFASYYDEMHQDNLKIQDEMSDPIALV